MNFDSFLNKKVLIRTYSAGVHYGIMSAYCPGQVILLDSRRIWYWVGALSLNEIAAKGIDTASSRISEPVSAIKLEGVIETIVINETSNLP